MNLVGNPVKSGSTTGCWKASPTFILPALGADRHRMTKASQIQFLEPYRDHRERRAIYALVEGFRDAQPWFEELYGRRDELLRMRALLLWGTKDPLFGVDSLIRFQEMLPFSETVMFPQVGRLVPEEASQMALDEIRWFLMNQPALSPKMY